MKRWGFVVTLVALVASLAVASPWRRTWKGKKKKRGKPSYPPVRDRGGGGREEVRERNMEAFNCCFSLAFLVSTLNDFLYPLSLMQCTILIAGFTV